MLPFVLKSKEEGHRRTNGYARAVDYVFANFQLKELDLAKGLNEVSDHLPIGGESNTLLEISKLKRQPAVFKFQTLW